MERKTVIIKNVALEIVDMLRDIRLEERRQLAAIFEDCVRSYWEDTYEEETEELASAL